jgi:tetratricopeptide (TPR) repeat protein
MDGIPRTVRFTKRDKLDYSDFHSRQTGKITDNQDHNTARELIGIKNAADEISAAQIEAAYVVAEAIEESTDRIVDSQNRNTDRVINSLEDLKATFDWKLSDMIWILEQQRDYLKGILEILKTPRLTQANELRESALKYYKNGWMEEAINDFNEAKRLNPTDFIIYQSLGNIYLFQRKDLEMALECYNNAAKYAIDYPYYISYALLHVGLTNYILGRYQDAYGATKEAIDRYPKFSEAYYQHAQYCSKLGKYDEALSNLRKAIDADRGYCAKALSEPDFAPMNVQLKYFFEDLTNEAKNRADIEIVKAQNLIDKFNRFVGVSTDAKEKLDEAIELKKVENYLNYREAINKAKVSEKIVIDSSIPIYNENLKLYDKFNKLKEKFNIFSPKIDRYMLMTKVSAPLLLCSIILSIEDYNEYIAVYIYEYLDNPESVIQSFLYILEYNALLFPIIISIFLYSSYKYVALSPQKVSRDELESLNKRIDENRQFLEMAEFEKSKLNIDKDAEKLDYKQYEKYLIRNYG